MSQDINQAAPEATSAVSQQANASVFPSMDKNNHVDPFEQTSTGAFFGGADRRALLDEVVHLCQFGNNLVAVLGDEGVGKTTFLSQARYELAETAFCCFITGDVLISPEDVFTQIIDQLELPVSPSSTAGEMIAVLRHAIAEGNLHRVVIIIDDAHYLNDAILSALASLLQGSQGNHMHLLLGGDQSLVQRLDQFEIIDVLVYDIALAPFSVADTREYLAFKLSAAGYSDLDTIDDHHIQSLWRETQGYPAAINDSAQSLLFQQETGTHRNNDDDTRGPGLPLTHMLLLVVLLAALIMALFYIKSDDGAAVEVLPPTVTILPSEHRSVVAEVPQAAPKPRDNTPNNNITNNNTPSNNRDLSSSEEQAINTANPDAVATSESENSPSPAPANPVDELDVVVAALESTDRQALPESTEADNNQPGSSRPELHAEAIKESLQQELKAEAEAIAAKDKDTPVAAPATQAPLAQSAAEKRVMAWPDDQYTLQVMAAGQQASLEAFIRRQANRDQLRLVSVMRNNQPWYIVVVGVYATSASARSAIQSLPQSQVNAGPWPRKISAIKQEIKAFRSK